MAVPYIFANATSAIPLSNLDNNFATPVTIGNVAIQLGNTVSAIGNVTLNSATLNNATAANVTISSVSTPITVAQGGTGLSSYTANAVVYAPTTSTLTTGSALKFDGSNLGIGVTPSAWANGTENVLQVKNASIYSYSTYEGGFQVNAYYSSGWKYISTDIATQYKQSSGAHSWYNAPSGTAGNAITFTQAMTLDSSGNLLVGTTTTAGNAGIQFGFNSGTCRYSVNHISGSASGEFYASFNYNGSSIGSITQNGTTGVLYNLTSDYRLKNNQEVLTGAKDFVMALKPKKWQWWDGSGEGVGFIAHEFMEVAKYSGHGEKDAVETVEIKNEEGNVTGTEQRPVYQAIQPSSSEVMANLVAFIQEQQSTIQSLTDRITALEAR